MRSLVCVLLLSLASLLHANDDPNASIRGAVQSELEDFSADWATRPAPAPGPALQDYQKRVRSIAGSQPEALSPRAGTIPLARPGRPTEKLGVTLYEPRGPSKGVILFVHGYLSHAANFAFTFDYFVRRGWSVVTLDLPGHGLSSGPRGDVDTFAEYGDAVVTWLKWVDKGPWKGPKVLLAHSLGSAASLDALRRPGTPRPDRIVFCAPLLRPDWYPALVAGEAGFGWMMRNIPSSFGWDGYLDGYSMPVHWFTALNKWLEELKNQPPLELPLTIYSGDKDDVVDEGWNREEYRRLVPRARYVVVPGKGHLFLTNKEDREAAHLMIAEAVEATDRANLWNSRAVLEQTVRGQTLSLVSSVHTPVGFSRGTLLFLHGYQSHAEDFPTVTGWFADQGWTVASLDLPGHGRSGGARFDIESFADYGDAVALWLDWVETQGWPGPKVLLAHSLGAAAALEALRRPNTPQPDRVVFAAPLLKTRWFGVLGLTGVLQPMFPGLPQPRWSAALVRWVDELSRQKPLALPLTVYSGDKDQVVDEVWNRGELSRLVPQAKITVLPGKNHWFLQNEGDREDFLVLLAADLGPTLLPPQGSSL